MLLCIWTKIAIIEEKYLKTREKWSVNYYLIDFENVKTDGIKNLHGVHKGDVMTFFYSENCHYFVT